MPWKVPTPKGIALESSSIGPVKIKSPVRDVWFSLISPDSDKLNQTSFMTYTLNNLDTNEKRFIGQFQFNSQELNREDGQHFADLLEFSMKHLRYDMTVREAVHTIRDFHTQSYKYT